MAKKEVKKVKLNDKFNKKNKNAEKYISDESRELKNFIFILLGIIVLVLIVYGVSRIFVKDKETTTDNEVIPGEVNYEIVSIGTMLNRIDKEYYVMIYDVEDPNAVLYSAIINKYASNEKAKPIYFCDLGNKLNSSYYVGKDGKSNPDAQEIKDLALKDVTLIKVKNGKITKYIEEIDTIKKELGK